MTLGSIESKSEGSKSACQAAIYSKALQPQLSTDPTRKYLPILLCSTLIMAAKHEENTAHKNFFASLELLSPGAEHLLQKSLPNNTQAILPSFTISRPFLTLSPRFPFSMSCPTSCFSAHISGFFAISFFLSILFGFLAGEAGFNPPNTRQSSHLFRIDSPSPSPSPSSPLSSKE